MALATNGAGGTIREKKLKDLGEIAETIRQLATPGMTPKALIQSVIDQHPEASKKEIARAALLSVILSTEFSPEETQALHDLAMDTRDDDTA